MEKTQTIEQVMTQASTLLVTDVLAFYFMIQIVIVLAVLGIAVAVCFMNSYFSSYELDEYEHP